jgi:hypothetical protein
MALNTPPPAPAIITTPPVMNKRTITGSDPYYWESTTQKPTSATVGWNVTGNANSMSAVSANPPSIQEVTLPPVPKEIKNDLPPVPSTTTKTGTAKTSPTKLTATDPYYADQMNSFGLKAQELAQQQGQKQFFDNRNNDIASKVANGSQNMSDQQLKGKIGEELTARNIDMNDPLVKQHYGDLTNDIQSRVRAWTPKTSSDDYFRALNTWTTFPGVKNPQMTQAMERVAKLQKYQNASPEKLASFIQEWSLLPGSQTRKDMETMGMWASLSQAKTTASFLERSKVSNSVVSNVLWSDKNKDLESNKSTPTETPDYRNTVAEDAMKWVPTNNIEAMQQYLWKNNPEILEANKDVEAKKKAFDDIKREVADFEDNMKATYLSWTMSSTFLNAMMREKMKPLMKDYDRANDAYQEATAALSTATESGKLDYQARQADQKATADAKQAAQTQSNRQSDYDLKKSSQDFSQEQTTQQTAQKTVDVNGTPMQWDPATQTYDKSVWPVNVANLQGADLMKALASGNVNGKKFFGVYATGDMSGQNRANIYNQAQDQWLEAFVSKYKGTKITPEMIQSSADKLWVDPLMIATVMAADSSMGTKWLGAKNNNPGNVWQFDSLGTTWVAGYKTLQEWVDAVAKNLRSRMDAMQKVAWSTIDNTQDAQVDLIANYKLNPTILSALQRKDPDAYNKLMNKVLQKNPNFDDTTYTSKQQTIKDFSPWGKSATTIWNFNTAVKHLWEMLDSTKELWWGNIKVLNQIANEYGRQTGDKRITNYETWRTMLAEEAAKVVSGKSSFNQEEMMHFYNMMDPSLSQWQLEDTLKQVMQGMVERSDTLKGMKDMFSYQTPEEAKKMQTTLMDKRAIETLQKHGMGVYLEELGIWWSGWETQWWGGLTQYALPTNTPTWAWTSASQPTQKPTQQQFIAWQTITYKWKKYKIDSDWKTLLPQ